MFIIHDPTVFYDIDDSMYLCMKIHVKVKKYLVKTYDVHKDKNAPYLSL